MNAVYDDFLGELLHETYRKGKAKKPNPNNAVSLAKQDLAAKIAQDANIQARDISDVALDTVIENVAPIQKFITSRGEVPLENPVEMAVQAFILRQQEIDDYATALGCSRTEAEMYLDEAEEKAASISSPEADNFLGGLFAAIGSVAGKGLAKAADKRAQQGKKPGVVGFLSNLFPAQGEKLDESQSTKDDLKQLASEAVANIKQQEKKKEIAKMLPLIIIGVVVLVLVVVLITRKASK